MHRLYEFLRRHPMWVDGFWAVCLLLIAAVWLVAEAEAGEFRRLSDWQLLAAVPISVALSVVVWLRRRWPEAMLLLAVAAGLAQLATDVFAVPPDFAMLVIVFTVACREVRWASRLALVGAFVGPPLAALRFAEEDGSTFGDIAALVFFLVCFLLAWVMGDSLRTRRAYYIELEERAARLEREREAQAKVAVAAERARIARELHDVVAHNVSVMVVQADGAAYVLDSAPEQTRQALETISGTGRQALAEMRRLLGVLRDDERGEAGEYVPQPGVEQLTELVEQVRGTGLTVDFRVDGTPRPLPSGVELTAYRIVQEALTNTRKHGGPEAGATVRITYGSDELSLLAEDDGRGAQAELYEEGGADGLGHGLIGMRERVGMVGGLLETGPRPGGGFRIRASLPLAGQS
ncbi:MULTISPECIES: sensor histidine kinase [unclassified Streptomyces]|uniref:sensor histidine kinase n=1 Tax=unclassified Streptomyces TaxID=2593676 RepID=UPI0022B7040B|nr:MULTISPECIES: sensor histidine kinase [unclassified Streptomyces]MCZ7415074.1 sensor histidine kinase [Streptomyces sp. WMMC897]MCZ7432017.1 sensor histidine kinase [Streptomyces sp. WMMC1477]